MFRALSKLQTSVFIVAFANGVIMAGFMMMLPLLPAYGEELGFSEYEIGLMVASFFIGRVLFQFPLGVLSDHFGRRVIIWSALALFTASTTAFALTTDVVPMIGLRLLQGVAASAFVVVTQSYVNDLTPSADRGLANGVMSSAINLGVVAGPLLGGTISQAFTLKAPFWAGGALGLISFFLTLTIPQVKKAHGPATPWPDILPQPSRFKRVLSAVWCLPALSLSLVHFLQMMGLAILLTAMPVLTAEVLSWSANDIALALALSGGAAAVSSPYLGRLSDRIGRIWVIAGGLAVMALEGLIIYLHPGTPLTMAAMALGGAGAPAYFNALYSLEGDVTRPEERGAVTGFVGSFGEWGSIIGSSLIVPLAWRNIGISAPMAIDVIVLAAGAMFTMAMRRALIRQVGRRSRLLPGNDRAQ